ncbi:MAG: nitroreductase/quinone reductase family protein [Gammaproteobacteria bacterium]
MSGWKHFARFHTWVYRKSGGRILGEVGLGRKILLLNTVGRRSGVARTSPLVYMPDGERFVIYGSNGGQEVPPAWFLNLQSMPEAEVEIGSRRTRVRSHVAEGAEEAALLPRAHAYNPHWSGYQQKAARRIPLVVLTPVG